MSIPDFHGDLFATSPSGTVEADKRNETHMSNAANGITSLSLGPFTHPLLLTAREDYFPPWVALLYPIECPHRHRKGCR